MVEAKCSEGGCRHKPIQKCVRLDVNIHDSEFEGNVNIYLCSQCLTDALEEFE